MTRINANIKPALLIDQHLIAEYREIVRIPSAVSKHIHSSAKPFPPQPKEFKLGTGHVVYFYDKIKFLHKRFLDLKQEMDNRSIANNMDDVQFRWAENTPQLYNDIHPILLEEANLLVVERIIERVSTMKREPTIKGERIGRSEYANMLRRYYTA